MTEPEGPTLCFVDCETTGLSPELHEVWEVALCIRKPASPEQRRAVEAAAAGVDDPTGAATIVPLLFDAPFGEREYLWQLPVDLGEADPFSLNIGRFHERRWPTLIRSTPNSPARDEVQRLSFDGQPPTPQAMKRCVIDRRDMESWAEEFAKLTWGAHMIGMVPSFDTDRLGRLLRLWRACPGWHYQPQDVETLAAGAILNNLKNLQRGSVRASQAAELATLPYDSEELSRFFGVDPDRFDRHSALGDVRWAAALWDSLHEVG